MSTQVELLIVSSRLEHKRALLQILDGLPLNVFAAGSVEQAEEALERHDISVIVCDERISDGTYHDVLALTADRKPKIEFILMMFMGGTQEFREALRNRTQRPTWLPEGTEAPVETDTVAVPRPTRYRRTICPHCGCARVWRSHRRGILERHVFGVFSLWPHRCSECDRRFYARPAAGVAAGKEA